MNGDSLPDLAVANSSTTSYSVTVLLDGTGGAYGAPINYSVGAVPEGVAIADLNADGKNDIATANNAGTASVVLGLGTGWPGTRTDYPMGASPGAIVANDLNGDGYPDLVVAEQASSAVSVLLAKCN
jgi:hypothetical protein